MAVQKGHPARSILGPFSAEALRVALQRLRANGLSSEEAAAEMLRKNLYDYLDSETDAQSRPCSRLRIVKR
ncbi:MAG TPA: hypothetical protein VIO32_08040 [Candidatus Baltobacteraceae bacterium]